jgi:hypothetical protein
LGDGVIEWFVTYWIEIIALSIIPCIFSVLMIGWWWECYQERKLEANPHRMDEDEMRSFNRKRFNK